MKRIDFWKETRLEVHPFWQPWGWGCLGRLLLFLLMLTVLVLLLGMLRRCRTADNHGGYSDPTDVDTLLVQPADPSDEDVTPPTPVDTAWNEPIRGGEEVGLPAPGDNFIPTPSPRNIVPNPEDGGATEIINNQLYVILDSEANDETFRVFAQRFNELYPQDDHQILYYNRHAKTLLLQVPAERRIAICQRLNEQITEVQFLVVPVELMTQGEATPPSDPAFSNEQLSWHFPPIQAYEAWAITQGSPDVVVGIVDSYMDLTHPELAGDRIVFPFSVPNQNTDVAPPAGIDSVMASHGSFVTSVAVGNIDNGAGAAGIAPKCKFMPVSIGQTLTNVHIVEGLLYCMYHGADVINISLGACFSDECHNMSIDEQIRFSEQVNLAQERMWNYVFSLAQARNVTIVWSAGNESLFGAMDASKRDPNTIRVAAVGHDLQRADFSNYGNFPTRNVHESTISAPGVDIYGALPGGGYDAWPGTSFAAPIITGTVALMKSLNQGLTTPEIIEILQQTGKPIADSPEIGNLVQIRDALLRVQGEFADFENLRDSINGDWESTDLRRVLDANFQPTGEKCRISFHFPNSQAGTLRIRKTDGTEYSAQLIVSIAQDQVTVRQCGPATAPGREDSFRAETFIMQPDENGRLCCRYLNSHGRSGFHLRRINP